MTHYPGVQMIFCLEPAPSLSKVAQSGANAQAPHEMTVELSSRSI
jgi:hypothetical protein